MRPPTFIGGNQQRVRALNRDRIASMRPPTFIGGNQQRVRALNRDRIASMRPPTFIGGNQRADALTSQIDDALQ